MKWKSVRKGTLLFDEDECVNNVFDFLLKFKGEERKVKNKIVEYNLQLQAQKGSRFDTWIKLNNLPCGKHIVDIIKNGKGIISMRIFNGYIQNNKKQLLQFLIFGCGKTHLNYSFENLGKTFKLKKELIKTEMNRDEIYAANWRDKKDEWVEYVKKDVLCTAFSYARNSKAMEVVSWFSVKDCLSLTGLGWKYFDSLRTEEDEPI